MHSTDDDYDIDRDPTFHARWVRAVTFAYCVALPAAAFFKLELWRSMLAWLP